MRHAEDPGRGLGPPAEAPRPPPHLEQHVHGQLLGRGRVPDEPREVAEKRLLVSAEQLEARQGFAVLRRELPWLAEPQLRAAVAYYQLYPQEIDARLAREEDWTPERLRRESEVLPRSPQLEPSSGGSY